MNQNTCISYQSTLCINAMQKKRKIGRLIVLRSIKLYSHVDEVMGFKAMNWWEKKNGTHWSGFWANSVAAFLLEKA